MAGAAMFTPFLLPHSHSPVRLIGSGPFNGADRRRQFIFSTQSPSRRHTHNASAVEDFPEQDLYLFDLEHITLLLHVCAKGVLLRLRRTGVKT